MHQFICNFSLNESNALNMPKSLFGIFISFKLCDVDFTISLKDTKIKEIMEDGFITGNCFIAIIKSSFHLTAKIWRINASARLF